MSPEVDLTLLCRWLAWGQITKWLQFLNSTCKIDDKPCAARPKKNFWFWWSFVTWPWPWPVLVRHLCSHGIFTTPLRLLWLIFEEKPSILPALGFIIQKRQNLTFDLTLTRKWRSILKYQVRFWETSWRAFERRLEGLDATIGSRDSISFSRLVNGNPSHHVPVFKYRKAY